MNLPLLASAPLLAAAALCLQGCDAVPRYRAAEGVHAFLSAVQKDDRAAFAVHIDRPKLESSLRQQIAAATVGGDEQDAASNNPVAQALINRAISPDAFRIVWMQSGVSIRRPPSALELVPLLKMIGDDRACLREPRSGECVLTFQDEGGVWKLVALRTEVSENDRPANA